jgi:L-amino acid N-acyltransferase YncA
MPESINFTELEESEIKEILDIFNYYVLNSTATFFVNELNVEEFIPLVFFSENFYKTFLIKDNNEIAGYCLLGPYKSRCGYAKTAEITIYLKSDFCGKGIGHQAISFLDEFAGKNNIHVIIAGVCTENKSSMQLFLNNGYEQCASFKEVGFKFGRYLDTAYFQKILRCEK